ncbi:hypothetical protein L7F22_067390 [Adiantum nelumboides]|nr:hypothetical protein [Adiantum nelumboides]MCO5613116.1 hypothetical protein [Adiantum nelumboides]
MKLVQIKKSFYEDLVRKPFFDDLVDYVTSGLVVAMVWSINGAALTNHKMFEATKPTISAPGTIRGVFAVDVRRNVIHGSNSVESVPREIELWFPNGITEWHNNLHN